MAFPSFASGAAAFSISPLGTAREVPGGPFIFSSGSSSVSVPVPVPPSSDAGSSTDADASASREAAGEYSSSKPAEGCTSRGAKSILPDARGAFLTGTLPDVAAAGTRTTTNNITTMTAHAIAAIGCGWCRAINLSARALCGQREGRWKEGTCRSAKLIIPRKNRSTFLGPHGERFRSREVVYGS